MWCHSLGQIHLDKVMERGREEPSFNEGLPCAKHCVVTSTILMASYVVPQTYIIVPSPLPGPGDTGEKEMNTVPTLNLFIGKTGISVPTS